MLEKHFVLSTEEKPMLNCKILVFAHRLKSLLYLKHAIIEILHACDCDVNTYNHRWASKLFRVPK